MSMNKKDKSRYKETPMPAYDINQGQIDDLLEKVNGDSSFLQMASNDQELINLMKSTILYQKEIVIKREKLVYAITHNVNYLADIHRKNNIEREEIKRTLA